MDNPEQQITTTHVFNNTNPRKYPQTRKVFYKFNPGEMAESPAFIDDSDNESVRPMHEHNHKLVKEVSSKGSNSVSYAKMLVQQVSMTYAGVRGASPPPPSKNFDVRRPICVETNLSLPTASAPRSRSNTTGSLRDYLASYDTRHSGEESVERLTSSGRHETEFPVHISYVGGDPLSPQSVYRVPIVTDSRATTTRLGSSLGSLLTETTDQRYEAFSARRSDMSSSPNNVNALKEQFERTAREQEREAQRSTQRRSPNNVVVIRPSPVPKAIHGSENVRTVPSEHFDDRVHHVVRSEYSPSDEHSVRSTTIVDIEPLNYGRKGKYIEETYQEEIRSIKTYTPGRSPTGYIDRVVHIDSSHGHNSGPISRSPSSNENRAATPVKAVVEKFESHVEESGTPRRTPIVDTFRKEIIRQSITTETRSSGVDRYAEEERLRREKELKRKEEEEHRHLEEIRIQEERRRLEMEDRRREEEIRMQEERRRQQLFIEEQRIEEIRRRRRLEQEQKEQEEARMQEEAERRTKEEARRLQLQRIEQQESRIRKEKEEKISKEKKEIEIRRMKEEEDEKRRKGEEERKRKLREEELRFSNEEKIRIRLEEIRIQKEEEQNRKKLEEHQTKQREEEEKQRRLREEENKRKQEEERLRKIKEEEEINRIRREEEIHVQLEIQRKEQEKLQLRLKREEEIQKEKEVRRRQEEEELRIRRISEERERKEKEDFEIRKRQAEKERRQREQEERRLEEQKHAEERRRIEEIRIAEEQRRHEEILRLERQRIEEERRREQERLDKQRLEAEQKQRLIEQRQIEEELRQKELIIIQEKRIEELRNKREKAEREEKERKETERLCLQKERELEDQRRQDRLREEQRRIKEEIRIKEERAKWEERLRLEDERRIAEEKERQSTDSKRHTSSVDTTYSTKIDGVSSSTIGTGATTTYTPIIGTGAELDRMQDDYRSTISARPGFNRQNINNYNSSASAYGGPVSGNRVLKIVNEVSSSTLSGLSPFGQHAASAIRDAREREKKEMSDLNDRLASYIEKVRFLEAQNRKLGSDLDLLRSKWGKDTSSIRTMYENELSEARKLISDTNRQRDDIEKDIRRLMDELADYRRKYETAFSSRDSDRLKIDDLLIKLSALESEINLLKRRISNLEDEVSRIKKDNHRLLGELQRARQDLDQETLNRIDYQNQVQTLLEEIDFIRRVNEQEIRDLQAMASRDTTSENREYFKNELSSAIRDIREEYDQISSVNRNDMESWYKLKVQEIHTQSVRTNMEQGYAKEEVKRLRVQLGDLRGKLTDLEGRNSLLEKQIQELNYQLEDDQRSYESALNDRDAQIRKMREECQALMVELQMLLDTKQTLDAEITIYRKMLEGEENRAGLRQLVEQVVKTTGLAHSEEHESMRVLKGETASRTSFQRSAKGNVSIQETSPDGKFIVLENTHRSRDESLGDWKLKRKIDGKREIVYTFPPNFVLRPSHTVKIFARGHGIPGPNTLIHEGDDSFGTGMNVQTTLFNSSGEERATHIQRSSRD